MKVADICEAAALVRRAQDKCEGCRTVWRLYGWKHRGVGSGRNMCTAKAERVKLREMVLETDRTK